MCELLAITSKKPTTVSMSLDQFASHGSDASANRDGWGIVYYSEDDIRRFRDTGPAAASEWVKFVEKQELCSTLFLAHIRNANVGKVSRDSGCSNNPVLVALKDGEIIMASEN